MTLAFYYGSGSPPSWKVWLALEHKKLEYELHILSFQGGDLKKPGYLKVNPRGRVPAIVDRDVTLYESSAIIEYLEEKYPNAPRLWPSSIVQRALARRAVEEASHYFYPKVRDLLGLTLFADKPSEANAIAEAKSHVKREFDWLERTIDGEYVAGELSAADFAIYPMVATARRLEQKMPSHALVDAFGPKTRTWMKLVESLPYYERTLPPHWRGVS